MTNKNLTKRALLTSVIAMLVCFTMLLGTTYAWFTDSVSSANNIITSGNLDIELYWSTDATNWQIVDENTNVFSNELWEPGHTEVFYLKVVNEGALALKYQLGINVESEVQGKNVEGKLFKLSDYIEFDVIEGVQTAFDNRTDALAVVEEGKVISAGFSRFATLENTDDADYLAMVVYMPTTVGNAANHDGENIPSIDLGINLVATQYTSEDDSFGDDYDIDALPCDIIATPETIQEILANANEGDVIGLADGNYFDMSIVIPVDGITLVSNTAIVDHVNVNGMDNVKLIGITFDAYAPYEVLKYETNGTPSGTGIYSNITSTDGPKGPENLQIINCNFIDISGVSAQKTNYCPIAIYDRSRTTGASNGIVIDGCTFNTNASYYVYMYYPGDPNIKPINDIIIRNNTFGDAFKTVGTAVYIGGTKNNVSVIDNTFINGSLVVAPHNNASCTYALKVSVIGNNFVNTTDATVNAIALRNFHSLPKCSTIVKDNIANFGSSEILAPYIDSNSYECYDINGGEVVSVSIDDKTALAEPNKVYLLGLGDYGQVPTIGEGSIVVGVEGTIFATHLDSLSWSNLTNVTFKNVTFQGNSAAKNVTINGTVTFDNCVFNAVANWIHFDQGAGAEDKLVFNDCNLIGWVTIGDAVESVEFNRCLFTNNGYLGGLRNYQNATATDCTFDYVDGMQGISPVANLTLVNCKNVNGTLEDVIDSAATGTVTIK